MISRALESLGLRPLSEQRPLTANWRIFRALVVVGACSTIAKLAATGKEIAVAGWFGRNDDLDAFLVAMILPTTVVGLLASSFSGSISPSYIKIREMQGVAAAQELFSSIQLASFVLLIGIFLLLAATAPYYLPILASGFNSEKLRLTLRLSYVVLPFLILSGVEAVWSAILNAGEKFALPAVIPVVTPLITVVFLLGLGRIWGVYALATGVVAGAFVELIILAFAMRAHGIRLRPRWYGVSSELLHVMRQYAPLAVSALIMSASFLINQSMAAMLKGGSVSALSYGNKIINVVTTLTSAAIYTAILPYFSQMVARKDWSACRRTVKVYSGLILAATIPLTLGLILASRPLVRVLYQRGAFTETDTAVVSTVQICFAIMIPFYTWATLFVRLLSSLTRNHILAYGAAINITLNVILNLLLMRRLGVAGIALATSIVSIFTCMFAGFFALKALRQEEQG